jgi:hypothetical protein
MGRLDNPLVERRHAVSNEVRQLKTTQHLLGFNLHGAVSGQPGFRAASPSFTIAKIWISPWV